MLFGIFDDCLEQGPGLIEVEIVKESGQDGLVVVDDGLDAEAELFDGNEGPWEVVSEGGQVFIGESGVFLLEMCGILLFLIEDGGSVLEEIVEGVEEFGLFCGFEIAESIGNLILSEGLDGLGFFRGFELVPNVPILLSGDVFVESFGLDQFGHQQQWWIYYIYKFYTFLY